VLGRKGVAGAGLRRRRRYKMIQAMSRSKAPPTVGPTIAPIRFPPDKPLLLAGAAVGELVDEVMVVF